MGHIFMVLVIRFINIVVTKLIGELRKGRYKR